MLIFCNANILSHINYSSTLWDGCSKDSLKKVDRLYRRSIKILSSTNNITTDDKMKQLIILPLNSHLKYNKAIIIHKIYHNKTPSYLNKLIKKAPDRYRSTNTIAPLPRIDLFKTSLAFSGTQI